MQRDSAVRRSRGGTKAESLSDKPPACMGGPSSRAEADECRGGALQALSPRPDGRSLLRLPRWWLQTPRVHANPLPALLESFCQLTPLQTLQLHENPRLALLKSFCQLTALQTPRLHENPLLAFLKSFGQLTALQTLRVHENPLLVNRSTVALAMLLSTSIVLCAHYDISLASNMTALKLQYQAEVCSHVF